MHVADVSFQPSIRDHICLFRTIARGSQGCLAIEQRENGREMLCTVDHLLFRFVEVPERERGTFSTSILVIR